MTQMIVLQPGDPFPSLTVALPGGRALRLPDALAGRFGVVLYYRGSWCPYCNAQLSAFQRSLDSLADADISVVALSVDDEATTEDLIARHSLRFPVGHSADAAAIARATGAFINPGPPYLQSTGFVLDPGGRVIVSVYSSGAIGLARPAGRRRPGRLPPRTPPGQLTPWPVANRRRMAAGTRQRRLPHVELFANREGTATSSQSAARAVRAGWRRP